MEFIVDYLGMFTFIFKILIWLLQTYSVNRFQYQRGTKVTRRTIETIFINFFIFPL